MSRHLFRGLAALLALTLSAFGGQLLFAGWASPDHAVHEVAWGLHEGLLMAVPLVLSLRRPERHPAAFRLVLAATTALLVTMLLVAELDAFTLVLALLVAVLLALHPARSQVLVLVKPDRLALAAGAVVATPLALLALDQAALQREAVAEVARMDYFTGVAASAVGLALALGVVLTTRGERAPAWCTALGFLVLGAASLVFPGQSSSVAAPWAAALVAVGATIVVVAITRGKRLVRSKPKPAVEFART